MSLTAWGTTTKVLNFDSRAIWITYPYTYIHQQAAVRCV